MALFHASFIGATKPTSKETLKRLKKYYGSSSSKKLTHDQRRQLFLCKLLGCEEVGSRLRERPALWPIVCDSIQLDGEDLLQAVEEAGEEEFLAEALPFVPPETSIRLMGLMGKKKRETKNRHEVLHLVEQAISANVACFGPESDDLLANANQLVQAALGVLDSTSTVTTAENLLLRLLMLKVSLGVPGAPECLRSIGGDWQRLLKLYDAPGQESSDLFETRGKKIPCSPLQKVADGCVTKLRASVSVAEWMAMWEESSGATTEWPLEPWRPQGEMAHWTLPSNMQWLIAHVAYECLERLKQVMEVGEENLLLAGASAKDVMATLRELSLSLSPLATKYDRRRELLLDEKSPVQLLETAREGETWMTEAVAEHVAGKRLEEAMRSKEVLHFLTRHSTRLTAFVRPIYRQVLVLNQEEATADLAKMLFFDVFKICLPKECLDLSKEHLKENGLSTKLKISSFDSALRTYLNKATEDDGGEKESDAGQEGVDIRYLMGLVMMDPKQVLGTLLSEGLNNMKKTNLVCSILSQLDYLLSVQIHQQDGDPSQFLLSGEICRCLRQTEGEEGLLGNLQELLKACSSANGGLAAASMAKGLFREVLDNPDGQVSVALVSALCTPLEIAPRKDIDRWTVMASCEIMRRCTTRRAKERMTVALKSLYLEGDELLRNTLTSLVPEIYVWATYKESEEDLGLMEAVLCSRKTTRLEGEDERSVLAVHLVAVWERLTPEQWKTLVAMDFPGFSSLEEKAVRLLDALQLIHTSSSPVSVESLKLFSTSLLTLAEDTSTGDFDNTESTLKVLVATAMALESAKSPAQAEPLVDLSHFLIGTALSNWLKGGAKNSEDFVRKLLPIVNHLPRDSQARSLCLAKIKSLLEENDS